MRFLVLCNGARGLSIRKLEAIWRFARNQVSSHRNNMDVQSSFCHDYCTPPSGQSLGTTPLRLQCLGQGETSTHVGTFTSLSDDRGLLVAIFKPRKYFDLNSETLKF
jgi:hypothetical protein